MGPSEPWTDASGLTPIDLMCASDGGLNVSAFIVYFCISDQPQSSDVSGFKSFHL